MNTYDLTVIGAGPGGYTAAIRAAQLGLSVAVIENRDVGGTCLNRGCIPTKTLLHSAELYGEFKNAADLGVFAEDIRFDLDKMYERKESVVTRMRTGIEQLFKSHKITLVRGTAQVIGTGLVSVHTSDGPVQVTSGNIIVAAGSVPAVPPIPGSNLPGVVTSDELLESPDRFESLVVIGGGVIGTEFAGIFAELDKNVTVIEGLDRLLPYADADISQNLAVIFKKKKIAVNTVCSVTLIEKSDEGLVVHFNKGDQTKSVTGDRVLISVGRKANSQNLFAENSGAVLERGFVKTDKNFLTDIPGVYAIGDIIGGIQLAHLAAAEGVAAVEHILGIPAETNLSLVPSCIYVNPEIAFVGMTQAEALEKGYEIEVGKYQTGSNGKTTIAKGERGFIKVIFEKNTGKLLGAHLFCLRATDIISELTSAIANGLTKADMQKTIRPHPTFSEAVTEAVESIDGLSIHSPAVARPNPLS